MLTFAEHYDFTNKTVHPFTTYAMSGLGHAALAVQGEKVEGSRPKVEAWLKRIKLSA
jgi:hypothetical protein